MGKILGFFKFVSANPVKVIAWFISGFLFGLTLSFNVGLETKMRTPEGVVSLFIVMALGALTSFLVGLYFAYSNKLNKVLEFSDKLAKFVSKNIYVIIVFLLGMFLGNSWGYSFWLEWFARH